MTGELVSEDRRTNICDLKKCPSSKRSPDLGSSVPKCTFCLSLGRVQSYSAVIFYLFILCVIKNAGCMSGSYSSTDWYRLQEDNTVVSYPPLNTFQSLTMSLKPSKIRGWFWYVFQCPLLVRFRIMFLCETFI